MAKKVKKPKKAPAYLKGLRPTTPEEMIKQAGVDHSLKAMMAKKFALWSQFSGIEVDGHKFSFDDHRYLLPIYLDENPHIVWMKAAQLGATIYMLLRLLWMCRYHTMKAALYFPTGEGVEVLSKDRLAPLIKSNKELYENLSDSVDTQGLKQINNIEQKISSLYMLYVGGRASKDSVPLDMVAFDEVRLIDPRDIDQCLERISHSSFKYKVMMSTCGLPNVDIHKRFLEGDQKVWHVRCNCTFGFVPSETFPECIVEHRGEVYLRCPKCKYRIVDPQYGGYVARNPGADVSSYSVSQLISRFISPKEIWEHFKSTTHMREFYNAKLGIPYIDAESRPVSPEVFDKCENKDLKWAKDCHNKKGTQPRAMGVDQHSGNCFIEGTKVFTSRGVLPIENVKIGDEVVTHKGNFSKVEQVHKNKLQDRQLYNLNVAKTPNITVTGNHKFWALSKEQMSRGEEPSWYSVEDLKNGDWIAIPNNKNLNNPISELDLNKVLESNSNCRISMSEDTIALSTKYNRINGMSGTPDKGVYSAQGKSVKRFWKLDNNFYRFLGLWYGDGCVFSEKRNSGSIKGITFSFSSKEKKLIKFVIEYGSALFGVSPIVQKSNQYNGVSIVFKYKILGEIFNKLFGRGAVGKRLPKWFYKLDYSSYYAFLLGLIESYGSVDTKGIAKVVLNNKSLVEGIYHKGRSLSIPLGLRKLKVCNNLTNYETKLYYEINFPNNHSIIYDLEKYYKDDRLNTRFRKKYNPKTVKSVQGQTFVRVNSVEKNSELNPKFVYTLGVQNDHSYSVEGLVAKNCYVVIMEKGKDGKKNVVHLEIIDSTNPRYYVTNEETGELGPTTPFKRLYELIKEYNVQMCVIDAMPNINEAQEFARSHPKKVFIAWYKDAGQDMVLWTDRTKTKEAIRKGSQEIRLKWQVLLKRYDTMDYALRMFSEGVMQIPTVKNLTQYCRDEKSGKFDTEFICERYRDHLGRLVREQESLDKEGENTGRYKHKWVYMGGDPHFAHANLYCLVALERLKHRALFAI